MSIRIFKLLLLGESLFIYLFHSILLGGSNRSQYTMVFDENSGLQKIQTPRGHFHGFNLKSSVGLTRFQYQAPWLEGPDLAFELMYNGQGQILRKRMASKGHEHVTYTYDGNDMLKKIMVGETESELGNLFCSLNNCTYVFPLGSREVS